MKKRPCLRLTKAILTITILAGALIFSCLGTARSSFMSARTLAVQNLRAIRANYLAAARARAIKRGPIKAAQAPPASWLQRVDTGRVCMVTNRLSQVPQTGIPLVGKTYYGACEGCAYNLRLNPSTRFAHDPYTGKRVDKADAAAFADASGRVWYFESAESEARFIRMAGEEPGR